MYCVERCDYLQTLRNKIKYLIKSYRVIYINMTVYIKIYLYIYEVLKIDLCMCMHVFVCG